MPAHWAMLHTIFRDLTPRNKPVPCPILGGHWELIGRPRRAARTTSAEDAVRPLGCRAAAATPPRRRRDAAATPPPRRFQGADPRTDVNRSMCCLAILQLVHFIEKESKLAHKAYRYANHDHKHWPYACTSIGFTLQAVQKLRDGALYKRCNALKGVLPALHECHAALFRDFLARIDAGVDRFRALNDVREGKKGPKLPKPAKAPSKKAAKATPDPSFASIGALPEEAAVATADKRLQRYAAA